jgi:hypothetical protein
MHEDSRTEEALKTVDDKNQGANKLAHDISERVATHFVATACRRSYARTRTDGSVMA